MALSHILQHVNKFMQIFEPALCKLKPINYYSCAVRRMSYKMGSVSSFWCHICACKFMLAYIYLAIFRVGGGVGDYLKYSPVAAKILLLSSENVWKYKKKAI